PFAQPRRAFAGDCRNRDADLRRGDREGGVPPWLPDHAGGGRRLFLCSRSARGDAPKLRDEIRLGGERRGCTLVAVGVSPLRMALDRNAIFVLLGVTVLAAMAAIPAFLDPANLANILRQAGVLGVLAIGQTFVITAGMIDLSIGMIAGMVVVASSVLLDGNAAMTLPVALLMLAAGAAIGAVNGLLLNLLRLH